MNLKPASKNWKLDLHGLLGIRRLRDVSVHFITSLLTGSSLILLIRRAQAVVYLTLSHDWVEPAGGDEQLWYTALKGNKVVMRAYTSLLSASGCELLA